MTKRRRAVSLFVLALLVVLAADTALWAWACRQLGEGVDQAVASLHDAGWTVHAGAPRWGGWPLAAALDYPNAAAAADPAVIPAAPTWTAQHLAVSLSVLDPHTIVAEPTGQQTAALAGIAPIPFTAGRMRLSANASEPPLLSAADLRVTLPAGELRIEAAQLGFPPGGLVVDATHLQPPHVDPAIDHLAFRLALSAPIPPGAVPADRMRAWRQAGGALDLTDATLHWADLNATARATLHLDPQLQPEGDGTLSATGLTPALDDLARTGLVPARATVAAKAVLALLAAPAPDRAVRLPVRLRDGTLAVAGFPLLRTPPLDWGPP